MKEKNEDVNDLTGNIGINSVSLIGPSMINFDNENSIIYNQRKFSVTNLKNRNSSLHFNLRHNKTLAVKIPRLLTELSKIKIMKKKLNSRKKSTVIANPKIFKMFHRNSTFKDKKYISPSKVDNDIHLSVIKEKDNEKEKYDKQIFHSPQIRKIKHKSVEKNELRKHQTIVPKRTNLDNLNQNENILVPEILRKFNLNADIDFNISKKWFLYQLKMSFLQSKKLVVSHQIENQYNANNFFFKNDNNTKSNYYDIFTNYSNIKIHEMESYEKYDDNNIKINHYIIFKNKLLGKGGFSAVYLSRDLEKGNKDIAVKITEKNARANRNKKLYDYVKEEVTILRRLHSKYIIEFYDIIESKKDIYIFMEYMKNNSLLTKIKDLTGFQVWRYFRNLLCAVEHCHEIGKIVHKDINVNNLLISEQDTIKLSDFGISVIIGNQDDLLPSNGPCTYSPPEKIYGNNNYYHGKSADMWLVGVTLFHMVFKKPLFSNFGNLTENDYKNITFPNNIDVDPRVTEILYSLLDFNPEKRLTIKDLRKNKWVTHNDEFPLPDIYDEALEYCYKLVTQKIERINKDDDNKKISDDGSISNFYDSDY
jgi:hypothetical protein